MQWREGRSREGGGGGGRKKEGEGGRRIEKKGRYCGKEEEKLEGEREGAGDTEEQSDGVTDRQGERGWERQTLKEWFIRKSSHENFNMWKQWCSQFLTCAVASDARTCICTTELENLPVWQTLDKLENDFNLASYQPGQQHFWLYGTQLVHVSWDVSAGSMCVYVIPKHEDRSHLRYNYGVVAGTDDVHVGYRCGY